MSPNAHPRRAKDSALRRFLASEAAGGILLMIAAALALIVANSPLGETYHHTLEMRAGPVLSAKLGPMTPHLWINDGLMAIFFLLVGLEIKRELVDGELSTPAARRLPFLAAAAGMALPAVIYLLVVAGDPRLTSGWAIPAATDIAFAIGVLALLGSRAPASLKLFLTTVAIVDDMGAVGIIALFYTDSLDLTALGAAAVTLMAMFGMAKLGIRSLVPYLVGFVILWFCVLLSGIHATIAGVAAAAAVPIVRSPGAPDDAGSPLHRLEHKLAPLVAYLIVPLFGFTNAGVSLAGIGWGDLFAPLPLAIAAGLFAGKQLGIFAAILLAVKLKAAEKPGGATWLQVYAVAILCGIGFTMSLFIGALAFPGDPQAVEDAKIGVLLGSLASALVGYIILRLAPQHAASEERS